MSRTTCQTNRVRPKARVPSEHDDVVAEVEEAINSMRREHDRLAKGLMLTVDLLGDVQHGERVHLQRLRRATANVLSDSLHKRERAIFLLMGWEQLSDADLERFLEAGAEPNEEGA